jgi:SAM-dependent methyltransferase
MRQTKVNILFSLHKLLSYTVAAVLMVYVLLQARKPTKWMGMLFLQAMNKGHSGLTDWGLAHVVIMNHFSILDVGCGGGETVRKLAMAATVGMVYGIDYAEGSVAASQARNRQLIKAGRVSIHKGSVSKLPFADNRFDLVTAVETQYYWPDLIEDMREILRVLKPGGRLIVIAETYKGGKYDKIKWPVMWLLRSSHLSVNGHRELFLEAGYTDVEIFEEHRKGWICGVAGKPLHAKAMRAEAI